MMRSRSGVASQPPSGLSNVRMHQRVIEARPSHTHSQDGPRRGNLLSYLENWNKSLKKIIKEMLLFSL